MPSKIFVNLPVRDLDRSKKFFDAIGFTINPQFTDETASCVVISEHIYVMLLTHKKAREFTSKDIADATRTTEVLIALSVDEKSDVDALFGRAVSAGGREARKPQDHGFMYEHAFEDPDGHIWEVFWMDPKALPPH
jgi:uncharacterized protein